MTHADHDTASTGSLPFSTVEWETLRGEDYSAAKAIILLMVSIFILGVLGYLVVCWSVTG